MTDPDATRRTMELVSYLNLLPQFAVRAMATLDIAGRIAAGTHEAGQLAQQTDTRPEMLGRLLQYLAVRGFLVETGPDTYDLAPYGRVLAEDSDFRDQLAVASPMHKMEQAYAGILETMRTGEPAYPAIHGRTLYEDFDADDDLTAASASALAGRAARAATELSTSYPWERVGSVLDVGGGDGATLLIVASAHPHLSGTVIDLPRSAALAERAIAHAGMADRLTTTARSFFEPLPRGHDVYLLTSILVDWSDEDAVTILRGCREACAPGGQIVVVDWLQGADSSHALMSHIDLHQLLLVGGRVRTVDELTALAAKADLETHHTVSFDSGVTMVVFRA